MLTLNVKRLHAGAALPTCAHPGEDLAYDLYALEETTLPPLVPVMVRTGIAVELQDHGFLVRDRSSMAAKGVVASAGVIDAGYRGEILVILTNISSRDSILLLKGDKIAQMIPVQPLTSYPVKPVEELAPAARGAKGFGSTGQ
jgi:dUTP pyrophosphatase